MIRRRTFASALGFLAAACSAPEAFNALTPKDAGAARVARDLAYGAHPRQRLDFYAPTERAAASRPLVVFFYGGSWNSGSKDIYPWLGRALAVQGFVVAIPDYRLVPEIRFPAFVEDGAAAVAEGRALAPAYGGDPDRVLLVGHSAGAHIALLLALDPRYAQGFGVPRAAVRGAAGLAGPYDFYPFDAPSSIAAFGRAPDPAATQPITFASRDDPPVWLATGDADTTVQPRNSRRLAAHLRAAGGRAEVRTYPGLDHLGIVLALSRPFRGRAPVLADLARFLHAATA